VRREGREGREGRNAHTAGGSFKRGTPHLIRLVASAIRPRFLPTCGLAKTCEAQMTKSQESPIQCLHHPAERTVQPSLFFTWFSSLLLYIFSSLFHQRILFDCRVFAVVPCRIRGANFVESNLTFGAACKTKHCIRAANSKTPSLSSLCYANAN
jgi:hypothetical protein